MTGRRRAPMKRHMELVGISMMVVMEIKRSEEIRTMQNALELDRMWMEPNAK